MSQLLFYFNSERAGVLGDGEVRNPDLMGNGRLPLVVQDLKYEEKSL